jgi:Right handed beta helix region
MTTRREFLRRTVITSLAGYGPIARAVAPASAPNPLSIDAPFSAAGFFDDPYSGFATWYVNGTTGVNTANPGVDRRAQGHVYRNYENAMADVFYPGNPGSRRIVVQAGTYAPLSNSVGGYFPSGGPDAAHPCVIQGDPTLAAPPIIDGGMSQWPAFCIGSKGGYGLGGVDLGNIVIRKLDIRNFTGDSFYFYWGSSTNVTIEYCNVRGNRYPVTTPSSSGAIGITSANCLNGLTVRYCKFSDFRTLAGGYNLNCVPFETYGSDNIAFYNCLFDGCYSAVRLKLLEKGGHGFGTANGFTIANNVFANCYAAIVVGTGSTYYISPSNWRVSGNLFYGPPLDVGGGNSASAWMNTGYVEAGAPRGNGIVWINNTFADDMSAGFGWIGAAGIVFRDNVCLSGRHFYTTSVAMGGSNGDTFLAVDNNAYGSGTRWNLGWSQDRYAFDYQYDTFGQWQSAYTRPRRVGGEAAATPPPDFAALPGSHNPDPNGLWIPSLRAPFNTLRGNFPNSAARDYTIAAGSPLLTASSTGGRVGYEPSNIGPGW